MVPNTREESVSFVCGGKLQLLLLFSIQVYVLIIHFTAVLFMNRCNHIQQSGFYH